MSAAWSRRPWIWASTSSIRPTITERPRKESARVLGSHRDEVFLTTKVWADDASEARESLEESLRILRTEHVDLVYLHSVGNRDVEKAMSPDGALAYLWKQKEAGKIRFVGISGHSMVENFMPILETGQIDVVMMAMNFVDRHTYGFEDKVLPVANRHQVGVACMKVFGGMRGGLRRGRRPESGPRNRLAVPRSWRFDTHSDYPASRHWSSVPTRSSNCGRM